MIGDTAGQAHVGDGATVVLGPRRSKQVKFLVVLAAIGGGVGALGWSENGWNTEALLCAAFAAFMFGFALLFLIWLLRGVPQLTIGADGLKLRGLYRTTAAAWSDVGAPRLTSQGTRRQSSQWLEVPLLGTGAANGAKPRTLRLPDYFTASLSEVATALLLAQRQAGVVPGVPVAPAAETDFGLARYRWPWLTTAIVALLVGVFAVELSYGIEPAVQPGTPALATLVALGGVSRDLVLSGQWWRVLTAPFLHASPLHLLGNSVVLLLVGYRLERFAGRAWTLCLFTLGALAGSLGSMVANAPDVVSVGASGAIMAMLAGMFVICFHLPEGRAKTAMLFYSLRVAIPSLIPFKGTAGTMVIDYGAHGGGALAGLLLGLVMLVSWRGAARLPGLRPLAALAGGAGVVAMAVAAVIAAATFPAYAAIGPLIPEARFDKPDELFADADQLLAAYPGDPRAAFFVGLTRLDAGNYPAAEARFRDAVQKLAFQQWRFAPQLLTDYRAELANALALQHRVGEARVAAAPACAATGAATADPAFAALLRQWQVCSAGGE